MTDALVIGAGHNGLICATLLAKAGLKVICLERSSSVGGLAGLRSLGENYRVPLAHTAFPLCAEIQRDLDLPSVGYQAGDPLSTTALSSQGNHLVFSGDSVSGADLSEADCSAYLRFQTAFTAYANAIRPLMLQAPPRLKNGDWADKRLLGQLAWRLRRGLAREQMEDFLRVAGANIRDVLDDHFDDPRIKGALAADAVRGHTMGPFSPGTVWTYLLRMKDALEGPLTAFDPALISRVLADAAAKAGVDLRLESSVANIQLNDGVAAGVTLQSGEVISADQIVSSADPVTTFSALVGAPNLDAMFAHRVSQIRTSGSMAKVHLALSDLPTFTGADSTTRMLLAPTVKTVERAFNPVKYGSIPGAPTLEILLPSLHCQDLAPAGHHVLSACVMHVPHTLKNGWSAEAKTSLLKNVLETLEQLAPGISKLIVESECLTPADIEAHYGVTGGHWHHGEMTMHQSLMLRPLYDAAQYATPVEGLYLCGAGGHPGGGINGLPGRNAAKHILAQRGTR